MRTTRSPWGITRGSCVTITTARCRPPSRAMPVKSSTTSLPLVESSDAQAQKTTLTRRLLVLRDRVDHLAYWLATHSDNKHADLSYEQTYATATADIAGEFCAELAGVQPCTEQPKQAPAPVKPLAGTDTRQLSIEV